MPTDRSDRADVAIRDRAVLADPCVDVRVVGEVQFDWEAKGHTPERVRIMVDAHIAALGGG